MTQVAHPHKSIPGGQRKLRIALVIKSFVATGGAERYAVETARRILEKGHSIDLYARDIDGSLTTGMNVFKIPDKMRFSSVLSLYSFARYSSGLLAGKQYDVVHSHEKGCGGDVATVHTFSFKRGMESMSFLKKVNEFGISPRAWLYIHMERQQVNSHQLVAVSEVIKKDIRTCHKRGEGITIIPPGVDIDRFNPEKVRAMRDAARRQEGLEANETAVLFVGSEFRRKGLDHLIQAMDKKMKLFVVGRKERMDYYKVLVSQKGLSGRVVFTGLTDNVLKYYALADILVLPSISEAFGMTVLEGMACGLPVVTSSAAGCAGLIESGVNGFVFEDPVELADMLGQLLDKDLRAKMGSRARDTAENNTWDEVARWYEHLYYEIVDKKTEDRGSEIDGLWEVLIKNKYDWQFHKKNKN